ncbi:MULTISPECIES: DUF2530 domain-containing protein [unclassified Pseudactinotalea]|uniref:DUF2530 domain-containing protein n=1 Tax=unclassified Pseudactinotalea TaxID=2649176 RepID=UPI00128E4A96|nr:MULTISPECIES: DUF2530 domain-containing protein [unclassified Pseudactinotalea]MPV48570.1 DUF2530 domain-containing protein [Pseudactinotalea sp. HY160]QGH68543.1 DUF2530 domain-containing protein [Pseudactinotalea sp. HY158]
MSETPPSELSPARVNAKAIFLAGIVGWILTIAALAIMRLAGAAPSNRYFLICIAGIVLGSIGYAWAHRMHLIDDAGMSENQEPARDEDSAA